MSLLGNSNEMDKTGESSRSIPNVVKKVDSFKNSLEVYRKQRDSKPIKVNEEQWDSKPIKVNEEKLVLPAPVLYKPPKCYNRVRNPVFTDALLKKQSEAPNQKTYELITALPRYYFPAPVTTGFFVFSAVFFIIGSFFLFIYRFKK